MGKKVMTGKINSAKSTIKESKEVQRNNIEEKIGA